MLCRALFNSNLNIDPRCTAQICVDVAVINRQDTFLVMQSFGHNRYYIGALLYGIMALLTFTCKGTDARIARLLTVVFCTPENLVSI